MGAIGDVAGAMMDYSAARDNERFTELAAVDTMRRGRGAKQSLYRQGAIAEGQQVTGLTVGGEDLSGEGAQAILSNTAQEVELAAIDIENAAKSEAWGLLTQGVIDRNAARRRQLGAFIGAGGEGLGALINSG